MTQESLETWLLVSVIVAAVCTTAFPVFYSFLRWRQSWIGRALMLQGIAFAAAMNLTLIFRFWMPSNEFVKFWVSFAVFTFIAFSTSMVTGVLIRTNVQNRSGNRHLSRRKKEQHV